MNQPFWIGGGKDFPHLADDLSRIRNWRCLAKMTRSGPFRTGTNEYGPILTPRVCIRFFLPQPSCSGSYSSHFHLQKARCESSSAKVHDEPKLLGAARPRRTLVFAGKRRGGIEQPEMMKYPRKKYLKNPPRMETFLWESMKWFGVPEKILRHSSLPSCQARLMCWTHSTEGCTLLALHPSNLFWNLNINFSKCSNKIGKIHINVLDKTMDFFSSIAFVPCGSRAVGLYQPWLMHGEHYFMNTLQESQGTNISHPGKRKIIFKHALGGDMLVPRRVWYCRPIWLDLFTCRARSKYIHTSWIRLQY